MIGAGGILAGVLFAAGFYVFRLYRSRDAAAVALEQPLPQLRREPVELQVAIHDLVELSPEGTAVRVCRSVASRRVRVEVAAGERLGPALDALARQVGGHVVVQAAWADGRALPSIPCAAGNEDYLVIGRP